MPTFEYQVLTPSGSAQRGTIFSSTLEAALEDLRRQGMQVQSLQPASMLNDPLGAGNAFGASIRPEAASAPPQTQASPPAASGDPLLEQRNYLATSVLGPLFGKVALKNLVFFFRQLSAMLAAGVPYAQTLHTLSTQTPDPKLRKVIHEMKDNVEAGLPISNAMQRYPEVFNAMMVSLVRVGEQTGGLDIVLRQIADYLEREIELRNLYRRVTIYPKLVLVAAVVIALITNAVIASLGKQGGINTPLANPAVWVVLGPLLVGLFLFLRVGLANPRVKQGWDQFLLLVPYLGHTVQQVSMARFGRAFSALFKAGVAMPQALQLSADACGNEAIRARIYPAIDRMRDGGELTPVLRETGAFSPIVLDMMATGESTGSVDQMLTKMSEYYEGESAVRSTQLGHVMGVVIYLMVAAYVAYTVVGFYSGYAGQLNELAE